MSIESLNMVGKNIFKGAKVGLVIVAACILVLVIGSSIIYFVYGRGSEMHSNLTPDAKKTIPTPTSTALLNPQPFFFDNFAGTNKGWSLGNVSGYTRLIENSTLMLANTNHNILTESLPANTTFDDCMVTVTFTLLKASQGDSVGLYLRGDSNLDHDYRLDLYGNHTYAISKEFLDVNKLPQIKFLVNPIDASTLNAAGQQNTVTWMIKGSKMVLLINGTLVNTVIDSDYTSGQIALFVQNSEISSEVKASFSSIAVYPAPEQLPSN